MPSPNSSPISAEPTTAASPSAIRASRQAAAAQLLSPTNAIVSAASLPRGGGSVQWTVTRMASTQSGDWEGNVSIDSDILTAMENEVGTLSTSLDAMEGEADTLTVNQGIPPSQSATRRSVLSAMRNALNSEGAAGRRRGLRSTQIPPAPSGSGSDELFTSYIMQLANQQNGSAPPGASAFEAITNSINATGRPNPAVAATNRGPSPLRNKLVYQLECAYCTHRVCHRAMKAILLADTKIELYSTDIPPTKLTLMDEDRMTQGCHCRIRDTVCTGCGNVLGYHVSQPCARCLDAKNNGHFWMFYSETIRAAERMDERTGKKLCWGALSPMRDGEESISLFLRFGDGRLYEMYCR